MRLGIQLEESTALEVAVEADRVGIAAVRIPSAPLGTATALAASVAALTSDVRLIVPLVLGVEHPITLAEEIAVVDRISGGRVVVVIEQGELDEDAAAEDLDLLRSCWTGAWVRHEGERRRAPAGIHGEESPRWIAVTPLPAQLEVSVWLDPLARPNAPLPRFAAAPEELSTAAGRPAPAIAALTGELARDRDLVGSWAAAGATLLVARLPEDGARDILEQHVARHLVPEATMPDFPRIISESPWPAAWPNSRTPQE